MTAPIKNCNWFSETTKGLREYWRDRDVGLLINDTDSRASLERLIFELRICGAKIKAIVAATMGYWGPENVPCWNICNVHKLPLKQLLQAKLIDIRHWLNKIDPDESITFLGGIRLNLSHLAGRPLYGRQRSTWAQFEDKTCIDDSLCRWGIKVPACRIVTPTINEAEKAFVSLDRGHGVIAAIDNSTSFSSGSDGLAWIT